MRTSASPERYRDRSEMCGMEAEATRACCPERGSHCTSGGVGGDAENPELAVVTSATYAPQVNRSFQLSNVIFLRLVLSPSTVVQSIYPPRSCSFFCFVFLFLMRRLEISIMSVILQLKYCDKYYKSSKVRLLLNDVFFFSFIKTLKM